MLDERNGRRLVERRSCESGRDGLRKSEFNPHPHPQSAPPGLLLRLIPGHSSGENTSLRRAEEWNPEAMAFDDGQNEDIRARQARANGGADEYLRCLQSLALFRKHPSLQSSGVTMGPKIGQWRFSRATRHEDA